MPRPPARRGVTAAATTTLVTTLGLLATPGVVSAAPTPAPSTHVASHDAMAAAAPTAARLSGELLFQTESGFTPGSKYWFAVGAPSGGLVPVRYGATEDAVVGKGVTWTVPGMGDTGPISPTADSGTCLADTSPTATSAAPCDGSAVQQYEWVDIPSGKALQNTSTKRYLGTASEGYDDSVQPAPTSTAYAGAIDTGRLTGVVTPPAARYTGQIIFTNGTGWYAATTVGGARVVGGQSIADVVGRGTDWTTPALGGTGPVSPADAPGTCLYPGGIDQLGPCDGSPHQQWAWTDVPGGKALQNKALDVTVTTGNTLGRDDYLEGGPAGVIELSYLTGDTAPPATPELTAAVSLDTDVTKDAQVTGTAAPGATVEVSAGANGDGTPLRSVTADRTTGAYTADITAPNVEGDYPIHVRQVVAGVPQTDGKNLTVQYGDRVVVTNPQNVASTSAGRVAFSGTGAAGSRIEVREQGSATVIGSLASVPGTKKWNLLTSAALDANRHDLVVTQTSRGNNVTTASVTINSAAAAAAPLVVESPKDNSTVSNPSKSVRFTGTGEPGARVQVLTQTSPARSVIDTTVGPSGTWGDTGDLNFDVDYTLDTRYTPVGSPTVAGTFHVRNTLAGGAVASNVQTPSENAVVVAPDKRVTVEGTATAGTTIRIWNWVGRDRVVAPVVTAGTDGKWSTVATLNNQATTYALFVEYTRAGATADQTRNIVVVDRPVAQVPFAVSNPSEDQRVSAPSKAVTIAGRATPGTEVRIWNWVGKDRVVAPVVSSGPNGDWSTVATLNNQDTLYALFVEHTDPGQATSALTRTITVAG